MPCGVSTTKASSVELLDDGSSPFPRSALIFATSTTTSILPVGGLKLLSLSCLSRVFVRSILLSLRPHSFTSPDRLSRRMRSLL